MHYERQVQPYSPEPPGSNQPRKVNAWLRLTSSGWDTQAHTIEEREKTRRSQLASWLILAYLVVAALLLVLGAGDPSSLLSVLVFAGALVVAAFLNHGGHVSIAAWLIIVVIWLAVIAALLLQPNGQLFLDSLPGFDLLVLTIMVAASVVSGPAAIGVGAVNVVVICLIFFLQPHSPDLQEDIRFYGSDAAGSLVLLARPVALEIIIAIVAFLWQSGTSSALRRADRAEEVAELQRREAERTRELEEGVRQLLDVHVRLANGDFKVHAQNIRNPLLWQIGNSLNNLINRLSRFAQADFVLRRTQDESRRVTEAIHAYLAGRQPIWPVPAQTPLDPIVEALRRGTGGAPGPAGQGAPRSMQPGSWSSPAQLPPSAGAPWSQANPPSNMPSQPASSGALPDWLRPLMPEGAPSMEPQQPPNPQPRYPQQPSGAGSAGDAQNNPWNLDPEANLPEWLRQAPDDGSEY